MLETAVFMIVAVEDTHCIIGICFSIRRSGFGYLRDRSRCYGGNLTARSVDHQIQTCQTESMMKAVSHSIGASNAHIDKVNMLKTGHDGVHG